MADLLYPKRRNKKPRKKQQKVLSKSLMMPGIRSVKSMPCRRIKQMSM